MSYIVKPFPIQSKLITMPKVKPLQNIVRKGEKAFWSILVRYSNKLVGPNPSKISNSQYLSYFDSIDRHE